MTSSRPGRAVNYLKRIKAAARRTRKMAALPGGARNRPVLGSVPTGPQVKPKIRI